MDEVLKASGTGCYKSCQNPLDFAAYMFMHIVMCPTAQPGFRD